MRPEDVGRRVYRTDDGGIYITDEMATRDSHPSIFELLAYLDLELRQEMPDTTYALGHFGKDGVITPWFETIGALELFCKENLETFRAQVWVM